MMKRILCFILCALTALCVCACEDGGSDPAVPATEATEISSSEIPSEADDSDVLSLKAFMQRFDDNPTVGDQLVYKDADLAVNVHGINYAPVAGPELHLTVNNNFGKDITVQAQYAAVNGYMITPELSIDVPAGKSANGNLTLSYFSLAIADITVIRNIQIVFRVVETQSYNPIFKTDLCTIKTSADQDQPSTFDGSGQTVYDSNDIRIVLKGVNTDRAYSDGAELMVYMYNGTDRSVAVQTGDVTVNGYDMTSVMNRTLLPGMHAVDMVTFYTLDLEEYSIDAIDSVNVSFEIKDADTWEAIDSTDTVSVELDR